MDPETFIRDNTIVTTTPLVPEIRLYLATEVTPLWQATAAYLEENDVEPPFWAFAWVGGQALARFLLDHREVAAGLRVLDVGSGGGIVSIAAALAGASQVTALDVDPLAATACRMNARLNSVDARIRTQTADAVRYDLTPFELVLVGDVCYSRSASGDLTYCLRNAPGRLLFGDPGRQFFPRDGLKRLANYRIETSRELEAAAITTAGVWCTMAGEAAPG